MCRGPAPGLTARTADRRRQLALRWRRIDRPAPCPSPGRTRTRSGSRGRACTQWACGPFWRSGLHALAGVLHDVGRPRPAGRRRRPATPRRCRCRSWRPAGFGRPCRARGGTGPCPSRTLVDERQLARGGIDRERADRAGRLALELSISLTAKTSRRFASSARNDGFGVSAASPSGTSVMFCETSRFCGLQPEK